MTKYAEGTMVSVERSRTELEKMLRRFGADQFMAAWDDETGRHITAFRMSGRQVRLEMPMPAMDDPGFWVTATGKRRAPEAAHDQFNQEVRRRWRSLLLVVKAKLTAVADGISSIEREFMADLVLPGGATLGEWAHPQLDEVYRSGQLPPMLPGVRGAIEA